MTRPVQTKTKSRRWTSFPWVLGLAHGRVGPSGYLHDDGIFRHWSSRPMTRGCIRCKRRHRVTREMQSIGLPCERCRGELKWNLTPEQAETLPLPFYRRGELVRWP